MEAHHFFIAFELIAGAQAGDKYLQEMLLTSNRLSAAYSSRAAYHLFSKTRSLCMSNGSLAWMHGNINNFYIHAA